MCAVDERRWATRGEVLAALDGGAVLWHVGLVDAEDDENPDLVVEFAPALVLDHGPSVDAVAEALSAAALPGVAEVVREDREFVLLAGDDADVVLDAERVGELVRDAVRGALRA